MPNDDPNLHAVFDRARSYLHYETSCDFGRSEHEIYELLPALRESGENKPACLLESWLWLDFDIDKASRELHRQKNILPSLALGEVLFDESNRGWEVVQTSSLVRFEHNCFFITRNTVYCLVGRGNRATVDLNMWKKIHGY